MAHFVAKELSQRPNEILDKWSVPELLVAFGNYANEKAHQNYEEWKHLSSDMRGRYEKPSKYIVKFWSEEQLREDNEEWQ